MRTHSEGMPTSLRRWYAGLAMQGMLSCQDFMNDLCKLKPDRASAREELARLAFAQADAMLAEAKRGAA